MTYEVLKVPRLSRRVHRSHAEPSSSPGSTLRDRVDAKDVRKRHAPKLAQLELKNVLELEI